MSTIQITGNCRVREQRHGSRISMPVGFRPGLAYRIVAGFFPNGSSDLHYLVINESGQTVPMRNDLVEILKENPINGDATKSIHVVELPFPEVRREWCTRAPEGKKLSSAIAYDVNGKQIIPHAIRRDTANQLLTVFWSFPVAGTLVLSWY